MPHQGFLECVFPRNAVFIKTKTCFIQGVWLQSSKLLHADACVTPSRGLLAGVFDTQYSKILKAIADLKWT